MYSTASRAAPSPPACDVAQCASALTSGRAFFTAIARPHLRIAGTSITSSPTKAASAAVIPSFSRICANTDALSWIPWYTWSIFRSRARRATVSEMRLVMIPVLIPASRANEIAVPSWAWKPLASIKFVLWRPNPCPSGREKRWADFSRMLCWALEGEPPDCESPDCQPSGAGKIQILPSVRTPSTSKRISLILRARAAAEGLGIPADSSIRAGRCGEAVSEPAGHLALRKSPLPLWKRRPRLAFHYADRQCQRRNSFESDHGVRGRTKASYAGGAASDATSRLRPCHVWQPPRGNELLPGLRRTFYETANSRYNLLCSPPSPLRWLGRTR